MLTLQENSLNWALQHALKHGDTDVFPTPFEYKALEHDWENIRNVLSEKDVLRWAVRPHRTLLSPKAKYSFRVITQLDPLDFILFSALLKEIGSDIEDRRIPTLDERVFSYRFAPEDDGRIFDPEIGYRNFLAAANKKLTDDSSITHVATADIADFYSRIYHHRLENALHSATNKTSHVKSVMHLLAGWNGTETYGIPVGNAPSRLLAEITLSDVDEALLANGIDFIRFNDDYRIFCSSHSEAYRAIVFLAGMLFNNHGLTLQSQKTTVFSVDEFREEHLSSPLDKELDSLHERFEALLAEIGITDRYEEIEYDDLEPEQKEEIDALNLTELFYEEINRDEEPDLPIIRFVLRRFGQLADSSLVDAVLSNLDVLHPAFPDIITYIQNLRHLNNAQRSRIGAKLITLLEDSIVSELDYHRMWALEVFSQSTDWNNEDKLVPMYNSSPDMPSKRKLILAMGRANQQHWFQSQWRSLFDHTHWPRRALLAAASCMPADARRHWYRSVEPQLDILELAIIRWAKQNPFHN